MVPAGRLGEPVTPQPAPRLSRTHALDASGGSWCPQSIPFRACSSPGHSPGRRMRRAGARTNCSSRLPVNDPRPGSSVKPRPVPSARPASFSRRAGSGPARTVSTGSGEASPKRNAPLPATASTCPSAASRATPRATAPPSLPAPRASPDFSLAHCEPGRIISIGQLAAVRSLGEHLAALAAASCSAVRKLR
jgi:hypothetical protein